MNKLDAHVVVASLREGQVMRLRPTEAEAWDWAAEWARRAFEPEDDGSGIKGWTSRQIVEDLRSRLDDSEWIDVVPAAGEGQLQAELDIIKQALSEHVLGGDTFELSEAIETILHWEKLADQECMGCAAMGPAAEIERLQAIVDKLPKINELKDGKVTQTCPAYPGMTVYVQLGSSVAYPGDDVYVLGVLSEYEVTAVERNAIYAKDRMGAIGSICPSDCANTREAAEAADIDRPKINERS